MKKVKNVESSALYYSQADIVRAFARELEIPDYLAKEYINIFFEIVLDKLSDADNVEIRLYNGLNIMSRFSPSDELRLKNIKPHKDKMLRLTLKSSTKLKDELYRMNKAKESDGG